MVHTGPTAGSASRSAMDSPPTGQKSIVILSPKGGRQAGLKVARATRGRTKDGSAIVPMEAAQRAISVAVPAGPAGRTARQSADMRASGSVPRWHWTPSRILTVSIGVPSLPRLNVVSDGRQGNSRRESLKPIAVDFSRVRARART